MTVHEGERDGPGSCRAGGESFRNRSWAPRVSMEAGCRAEELDKGCLVREEEHGGHCVVAGAIRKPTFGQRTRRALCKSTCPHVSVGVGEHAEI